MSQGIPPFFLLESVQDFQNGRTKVGRDVPVLWADEMKRKEEEPYVEEK